MPAPTEFLEYVDRNASGFINRLKEAVEIKSVSSDVSRRPDVIKMGEWLEKQLQALGVTTKQVDLGKHEMSGHTLQLPPAILGKIGEDKSKKTVLIYGHYDVQPAKLSDGWNQEPFEFVEKDGLLLGRGSTDDKGPIMGWINVLEAHQKLGKPLPVNLKFVFEGMEEYGSEGLDELVIREAQPGGWIHGVDCVCISDNYWLNTRTPALTYGLRGIDYYGITITGPGQDLHSGLFGRTVHEPMTDLIKLMGSLVDVNGGIKVPGVEELVPPPTEEELQLYHKMDYETADIEAAAGGPVALSQNKIDVLMGRMRYPSLSLHGIEGAFSDPGAKTVIPAKVTGKFSIRLVPPQTPAQVEPLVRAYVEQQFAALNSRNKMTFGSLHSGSPWVADINHWNFRAAHKAVKAVWGIDPDYTREGGSIPVTLTFAESLGVNVLLLPMGRADDGAHSTNEKLDRSNYIEGTKMLGAYLYEVAAESSA
ncbi:CNDP dipeptidase [Coniophora puteana RWD-64-598 SS2]|uniref:CNDP dipeptidase n=1 Tax=Coniophora puteana (strain RWD-64-598) TaxID=741705 RepID=A0A5M3MLL9_CONPW|nr:CNDP dipeptidase [Coniophora puteana RWD-64-598 SS2]EIW80058.1 CNDP dipeptidase [Coniophora puteana RWD-64-598 SS2]